MSLPSLFLRIQDPALKEAIASCQELHKFRLYDTETDDDWIDHFVDVNRMSRLSKWHISLTLITSDFPISKPFTTWT